MLVIPLLPNTPSCHNEFLQEQWGGMRASVILYSLYSAQERFLVKPKFGPTKFTESACEDHVFHCFLNVQTTQEAIVVISYVVVPPFQHVPRIEHVMEEQQGKDLQLHRAL